MKEQTFGSDPLANAAVAEKAQNAAAEGPILALRPLEPAGEDDPDLISPGAGIAGLDFPQITPPQARPAGPAPGLPAAPAPAAAPERHAAAASFPEIAMGPTATAGDATSPARPRGSGPTVSIGGGLGALRSAPRPQRTSSMVLAATVAVSGVCAAAYLWFGLGSWPLAAVVGLLGMVGALFSWVLLEG